MLLAWVEEGLEDEASYNHVKTGSYNSVRGMAYKIKHGLIAHCKAPPFGIDRLYVNADLKPICIIRNLQDGRQLRLHHETKEVLETYPKEIKGTEVRCHLALQTQPPDVRDNRVQNQPAFRDSIYLIRSI